MAGTATQVRDNLATVIIDGRKALSEERLRWHLLNWAEWFERSGMNLSAHISSVYRDRVFMSDFDSMCDESDHAAAKITDAAIESLDPVERCAVTHKHLVAVYRFNRETVDSAYSRACRTLAVELLKRGLV